MGRAGDSFDDEFPPRSGGRSPRRHDPLVGGKRGGPWVKMVVAVAAAAAVVVVVVVVVVESHDFFKSMITSEPDGPRRVVFAWVLQTFRKL